MSRPGGWGAENSRWGPATVRMRGAGDAAMLIHVPPAEIRLGMFIHSFEGRWSDRPLWRSGFLLEDSEDLARLRASRITAIVIDSEKGVPPATRAPRAGEAQAARRPVMDAATARATRTVNRARKTMVRLADDIRLGRPIAVAQLAPLVATLAAEVEQNQAAILGVLRLKSRDQYTYLHSVAVSALMMNLATTLGLDPTSLPEIGMAGLLHDAGKIAIPDAILNKPGALDDCEFAVMQTHPARGHRLLSRSAGVPEIARDVCLHHHERPDGCGYPEGLAGAQLSLAARMGAICDVYDALTSDRAYKDAWSPQRALAAMLEWEGQFDPALLRAFLRSLGIFPVGSLVKVRDSALAVVLADNADDPTCPVVRAFHSIRTGRRVACEDISVKISGILTLEDPADWGFADWPQQAAILLSDAPDGPAARFKVSAR